MRRVYLLCLALAGALLGSEVTPDAQPEYEDWYQTMREAREAPAAERLALAQRISRSVVKYRSYRDVVRSIPGRLFRDDKDGSQRLQWLLADPLVAIRQPDVGDDVVEALLERIDSRPRSFEPPTAQRWANLAENLPDRLEDDAIAGLLTFSGGRHLLSWHRGKGLTPVRAFIDSLEDLPPNQRKVAGLLAAQTWLTTPWIKKANEDPEFAARLATDLRLWLTEMVGDEAIDPRVRIGIMAHFLHWEPIARGRNAAIRLVDDTTLLEALPLLAQAWPTQDAPHVEHALVPVLVALDGMPRSQAWQDGIAGFLEGLTTVPVQARFPMRPPRKWEREASSFESYRRQNLPIALAAIVCAWAWEIGADGTAERLRGLSAEAGADPSQTFGFMVSLAARGRGDVARLMWLEATGPIAPWTGPFYLSEHDHAAMKALAVPGSADRALISQLAASLPAKPTHPAHWRRLATIDRADDVVGKRLEQPLSEVARLAQAGQLDEQMIDSAVQAAVVDPLAAAIPLADLCLSRWRAADAQDRQQAWWRPLEWTVTVGALLRADEGVLDRRLEELTAKEDGVLNMHWKRDLESAWEHEDCWRWWGPEARYRLAAFYRRVLTHQLTSEPGRKVYSGAIIRATALHLVNDELPALLETIQSAGGNQAGGSEVLSGAGGVLKTLAHWVRQDEPGAAERERVLRAFFASREHLPWNGYSHKNLLGHCLATGLVRTDELDTWASWILSFSHEPGRDGGGVAGSLLRDGETELAKAVYRITLRHCELLDDERNSKRIQRALDKIIGQEKAAEEAALKKALAKERAARQAKERAAQRAAEESARSKQHEQQKQPQAAAQQGDVPAGTDATTTSQTPTRPAKPVKPTGKKPSAPASTTGANDF